MTDEHMVALSDDDEKTILIDTKKNSITIKNNITAGDNIEKIIFPADISDLFFDIKEYLDTIAVNILDKTPRSKQISDFSKLLYKYIPKNKTDLFDETDKNYIDENGWQQA